MHYTVECAAPFSHRPSNWSSGPPSNARFLEPTRVLNPNGISIGSVKGKERKSIYIALFLAKEVHSKRSGMDHTVYLQITACLPFLRERSPDVTTTATEAPDIQLQLTTHLSTPKG